MLPSEEYRLAWHQTHTEAFGRGRGKFLESEASLLYPTAQIPTVKSDMVLLAEVS